MKIVIDTNVVASAIFFGGRPRQLLEMLLKKELESFVTQEIIDEYKDTVDYLKNKYSSKPLQIPLTHIISACRLIESNTVVKVCLAGISLLYISKPEKGELCMAEIISICVLLRE